MTSDRMAPTSRDVTNAGRTSSLGARTSRVWVGYELKELKMTEKVKLSTMCRT